MKVSELEEMVKASKFGKEILKAEKNNRVKVFLPEKTFILKKGKGKFKIMILWKNENSKVIKKLVLNEKISIENPDEEGNKYLEKIEEYYIIIAKFGFPVILILLGMFN